MTLDFEEAAVGRPGRHSQVVRFLRTMARMTACDWRPVPIRWNRKDRHYTLSPGRNQGGGTAQRIYDAEFYGAVRAGWITPAADPPDGTWMLTESGRQLVRDLG